MTDPSPYSDNGWYRTFFHGLANDLWRQAVPRETTQKQAEFLVQNGGVTTGAAVLDVPCGNGRIALELAARGLNVTGVDLSEESIAEARQQAAARGLAVDYHRQDMRELPWSAHFDLAICWGNSFGYLDDAGDVQFLDAVAKALKPGGRFILETGSIAEALWPQFQAQRSYEFGDIHFHASRKYDLRQSRLHIEYEFRRGDQRVVQPASQRVYTVRELCERFTQAGLDVESLLGGIDGQPFTIGSPQLIALAKKAN